MTTWRHVSNLSPWKPTSQGSFETGWHSFMKPRGLGQVLSQFDRSVLEIQKVQDCRGHAGIAGKTRHTLRHTLPCAHYTCPIRVTEASQWRELEAGKVLTRAIRVHCHVHSQDLFSNDVHTYNPFLHLWSLGVEEQLGAQAKEVLRSCQGHKRHKV